MERGICPIAVFYFAVKRSFFNIIKKLVGQQRYKCYHILGHVTSSVTWPYDPQWVVLLYVYHWHQPCNTNPVSCTVSEILSLKYFGVMTLTVYGHVVIGHVTIRLAEGGFL